MLLADAAILYKRLKESYLSWRRDPSNKAKAFHDCLQSLEEAFETFGIDGDMEEIIDVFYPKYSKYERQFVSMQWIRNNICKKLGISPLYWDEAMAGKAIVPMLASESNLLGGEGWTVKQALMAMHRIKNRGCIKIASQMNEDEAILFWARALGEQEPIPIDRLLQMFSYLPRTEGIQTLTNIRLMLSIMSPMEVLIKILHDTDKDNTVLVNQFIQAGQPFQGPMYRAWSQSIVPQGVYAEVIDKPRRYLHITEFPVGTFRGILYTRDKQSVGKVLGPFLPIKGTECVMEVVMNGPEVEAITDIMSYGQDWELFKQPYAERISFLERLNLDTPIRGGRLLEEGSSIANLLTTLEGQERIRLIKSGPFQLGEEAGWLVMQKAFHMHFLVTGVMRDDEFITHLSLAVLDGYETYEVLRTTCDNTVGQHIRNRLARHGVLAGSSWMPVDEYAAIVVAEVTDFDLDFLEVKSATILYADDNLGYSDVSQLTDLIELVG
jgi:hypothetical protein